MSYSRDRLNHQLFDALGDALRHHNDVFHFEAASAVDSIHADYLSIRREMLRVDSSTKYPRGLILVYEERVEENTGLAIGYIHWRYGRFWANAQPGMKARSGSAITRRVQRRSRNTDGHYSKSDLFAVMDDCPDWERRLVWYTEQKARPLRTTLKRFERAQRTYLHTQRPSVVTLNIEDIA